MLPQNEGLDYRGRFFVEYSELTERLESLENMLDKYAAGTLDFTPTCDIELLQTQAHVMREYKGILESRAAIEGVPL